MYGNLINISINDNNCPIIQGCSNRATPASVHLPGLSLVFRLKVHTYVGPRVRVLYKGHSYMLRRSCLSCVIACKMKKRLNDRNW